MNLSLLPKLFLILAVLFTAPGFSMSANHEACALPINLSAEHHSSSHSANRSDNSDSSAAHHSVIQSSAAQHQHTHDATNDSTGHCLDASHCMLCFSVLPSVTLSVTKADSYKPDSVVLNNWLSRTLKPEPYPPRHLSA